jgi:hypothetical protein
MHYFIFGPSGVGKTSFGKFLQRTGIYRHIPIDLGLDGDGMVSAGLKEAWDRFCTGDIGPFIQQLDALAGGTRGCVLTFNSYFVYSRDIVEALAPHSIAVRYLYAPKEHCINAYLKRERRKGGDPRASREFWESNNKTYEAMCGDALAPYRVDVITPAGNYRPRSRIARWLRIPID